MELTFDDFRSRANDPSLSKWEKIGFPDSYRKDTELQIFDDIRNKLGLAQAGIKTILDIGCGCSELVNHIIDFSVSNNQELTLVDSAEMLAGISDEKKNNEHIKLLPGYFPKINFWFEEEKRSAHYDAILIYSVIQYPFIEQSIFQFIHRCVDLLNPGGRILIGDIPNVSARDRFMRSSEGEAFSKSGLAASASTRFEHENKERIDDAVIMSVLQRYRNFGCETYLLPQPQGLPFFNRREDILIIKRK